MPRCRIPYMLETFMVRGSRIQAHADQLTKAASALPEAALELVPEAGIELARLAGIFHFGFRRRRSGRNGVRGLVNAFTIAFGRVCLRRSRSHYSSESLSAPGWLGISSDLRPGPRRV